MRLSTRIVLATLTLVITSESDALRAQTPLTITGYARADFATRVRDDGFWCFVGEDERRLDYTDAEATLVLPAFGAQLRAALGRRHGLSAGLGYSGMGYDATVVRAFEFLDEPALSGHRYDLLTVPLGYDYRLIDRVSGVRLSLATGVEVTYLLRARDRWTNPDGGTFYAPIGAPVPNVQAAVYASLPVEFAISARTHLRIEPTARMLTRRPEFFGTSQLATLGVAAGATVNL